MHPRGKALVVDDDAALLKLVGLSLSDEGYDVMCAHDGLEALRMFFSSRPDLIVLDIMLPEMNGWEVCQRIREVSNVPILILTARGNPEDRIRGLELGADDYLSKPFELHELVLRVGAVLRRTLGGSAGIAESRSHHRYDDGHLLVDLDSRTVQYDGRAIGLTPHEFDLLACFVRQPGRILERDYLLREVWGLTEGRRGAEYVKTYIRYLRTKIEPDPERPRYILTERGIGYRLAWKPKKQASSQP